MTGLLKRKERRGGRKRDTGRGQKEKGETKVMGELERQEEE